MLVEEVVQHPLEEMLLEQQLQVTVVLAKHRLFLVPLFPMLVEVVALHIFLVEQELEELEVLVVGETVAQTEIHQPLEP
jgi:hypothetical protein